MRRRIPFALCTLVLIAGCSKADDKLTKTSEPPAQDPTVVQAAIDSSNHAFLSALQAGDTAKATMNYDAEAILMMPGDEAWTASNLHQKMVDFMKAYTIKDAKLTSTAPLILTGDYAIETGIFEWTMQPKTGKPITDKGKYLTVWKKQADGSWKILRDINNTSLAM